MDRRLFIATASTAAVALAVPAAAQESGAKSLPEHFAATLSAHDIPAFAALFADDYVNHQVSAAAPSPPPDKSPKQATVGFFAARLAGIPDLQVAIEATVASNDMVAASFIYTGTPTMATFASIHSPASIMVGSQPGVVPILGLSATRCSYLLR
jgi:SnoaL-like domain